MFKSLFCYRYECKEIKGINYLRSRNRDFVGFLFCFDTSPSFILAFFRLRKPSKHNVNNSGKIISNFPPFQTLINKQRILLFGVIFSAETRKILALVVINRITVSISGAENSREERTRSIYALRLYLFSLKNLLTK